MDQSIITIIILILAVISFLAEKIPVNLTIMLTMISLVFTGIVTPEEAVSGFSSKTILMLIGVVIVGSALFETGVTKRVAEKVKKYAKTERQMIMAILILTSLLSSALSNSGTVAVFIPIIMGIAETTGYSHSKLLMSAFLGSMSGGRLTLVGDAAINVMLQEKIQSLGFEFGFFEITKIGAPLTIVMLIYMYLIGYKLLPDIPLKKAEKITFEQNNIESPKWKRYASVGVLLLVFIGMIFEKQTGIPSYMVAIIGAVAVVVLGIFNEKEAYNLVSVQTIILLGGMKPMAIALENTGAAQMIADQVINIIGNSTNVYFITAVIFIVTTIMTQFMSNVVTVQLLIPIILAISNSIGVIPSALILITGIASTNSILTPIACPPANLIYSYGGYKFNDYFKSNILLALIQMITSIVLIPILVPLY